MLDHGFRVTKYDPRLRDGRGAFIGDDWTSIGEIGHTFDGRILTRERYEQVESAYLTAAELFARDSGVTELAVRTPAVLTAGVSSGLLLPNYGPAVSGLSAEEFYDGREVPLPVALEVVRAMLREDGVWCRLEAQDRFSLAVGWDYYLYIGSHRPCLQAVAKVRQLGLFVEEDHTSPYDLDLQEPVPYRPADETFWAEVGLLSTQTDGAVPLLVMWAGNAWRWHLVTPGNVMDRGRAALRPRALLTAFIGTPVMVSDDSMSEIAKRGQRLLHADSSVAGVMCLMEDKSTGQLLHDYLLDDDDFSTWLETARQAGRCEIYPADAADQPGALVAVLPDSDGIVRARWD
ncbi:hypothetical protein Acor_84680 [Acrocarpospora corrugata]|uniref:Uncharacterized protein n=1 Tax=Acrocarpospora corrugata TaxID=35763 RepID=A0A5M3WDI9_9ACTN|nr:hypothetical protein [Acrocarpospora corrugata]GES06399.1 hypothetical protein Acor_84680 [Acrocarpospora corrugata]